MSATLTLTRRQLREAAQRKEHARAFLAEKPAKNQAWASKSYAYDYTPEEAPMYLGWFDDNPKKDATDKAKDAIAAYRERFGELPNVILVNAADRVELGGIVIRVESYIRRNNFWVGWEG